ncbi:MFS transporter [Streptomyces sp. NPDC050147]|uniref:MFS transporter n=1 Tax=Streptomyces sp. NPDC050147 TaxID=3155513 RepID=UPI0034163C71
MTGERVGQQNTALPGLRERLVVRMRTPWWAMFAICFASAVVLLDTTAVNVALAEIGTGLDAGLDQVLWVVNAYLLSYAALLVIGGRLADMFGPRRVFLAGLAVFTVSSVGCGMAQDAGQAIAARLAQGVGAALLTPQTIVIITRIFPAERRGKAMGVWGGFAGIVAAAGPTFGGLLAASLGWRWIFYINVPVGIIGAVLVLLAVPKLDTGKKQRLDVLGASVLAVAMLAIVYALLEGEAHNWGSLWGPVTVPVLAGAGILALGAFFLVERERQGRDPLIPFAVLRDRNFSLMAVVVCVLPCGLGGVMLLTPLYLQDVQEFSAFQAGLLVAVAPLVSVFIAPYSGTLTDRFGGKYVLITGLGFFAGGIALMGALIQDGSGWTVLLPGLICVGIGMGVGFAPASVVAFRNIDPDMAGSASGVFNTTRLSGSLLGSAAVGAVLQAQLATGDATTAIKFTMFLPVAIMSAGALLTLAIRESAPGTANEKVAEPEPEPAAESAAESGAGTEQESSVGLR